MHIQQHIIFSIRYFPFLNSDAYFLFLGTSIHYWFHCMTPLRHGDLSFNYSCFTSSRNYEFYTAHIWPVWNKTRVIWGIDQWVDPPKLGCDYVSMYLVVGHERLECSQINYWCDGITNVCLNCQPNISNKNKIHVINCIDTPMSLSFFQFPSPMSTGHVSDQTLINTLYHIYRCLQWISA